MGENFSAEDQAMLRDTVSRFVAERYPFELYRQVLESATGYSPSAWQELADLGLLGLLVEEADGGAGASDEELAIVMESLGRGMLPEPYLSTAVLGAGLIGALDGSDQRGRRLADIGAGKLIVALAHGEPEMGYARAPVATAVRQTPAGLALDGVKSFVMDGPLADLLLVTAAEGGGLSLFAVPRQAPGLTLSPWRTADRRHGADLRLDQVPVSAADRIGPPGGAEAALDLVLDRAALAVAAEAVGAMDAVLNASRDYLQVRVQFGKPLAQFQALQHRLVDMFIALSEARAVLQSALRSLGMGRSERNAAVSVAKLKVGEAARFVGAQGIQLHGAIGMTSELAVSHYFRRLLMADALFGNSEFHFARFRAGLAAQG